MVASLLGLPRPDGPPLDPALVALALQQPLHVDARRVHLVRVEVPRLHQVLHLGDGDLRGGGHHGLEVPGGLPVDEVAPGVALPGADQREVGVERELEQVLAAGEGARLLPLRHLRADAGGGVEAADAGAAGADPLRQRPLRHELHLQLAGEVLALELLVLAHVRRDDLPDLPRLQQHAEAELGGAAVVGDERQVLHALPVQRQDEVLGVPAQAEPAHHQRGAVLHVRHGRVGRLDDLVHGRASYRSTTSATASPPPMQSEARPRCLPRSFMAYRSVTRMRAPEAPMGWPSATAPPRTFTPFGSSPSSRLFAIATTANASLISQRSTSEVWSFAFSSVFRMASAGAMVNSTGARAAPPQARRRASTGRPSRAARSALISTTAAPPSLIDDE